MKATPQEAEKAWQDHFVKRFYLSTPEERITSAALLKDFKAAYRKALEEESGRALKHGGSADYLNALVFAVERLETVTPEK